MWFNFTYGFKCSSQYTKMIYSLFLNVEKNHFLCNCLIFLNLVYRGNSEKIQSTTL